MSSSVDLVIFDADRGWLENQVCMRPWDAGCTMLAEQLDGWLNEYWRKRVAGDGPATMPNREAYLARLWQCWRHHWQAAANEAPDGEVDGLEVAESIRDGRSPVGHASLGSDPLADVVMAQAVLDQNEAARRKFHDGYRDFALGLAGRIAPRLAGDESWWSDLVSKLAGDLDPPGKLTQYKGRCGLQNWLGTIVRREALNSVRADHASSGRTAAAGAHRGFVEAGEGDSRVQATTSEAPEHSLISRECRDLFVRLISKAMNCLPADDRLLLAMLLVDERPGTQVASILGIHPGNVTRRRGAAIERLQRELAKAGAGTSSYEPCLEQLLTGSERASFADLLATALRSRSEGATA